MNEGVGLFQGRRMGGILPERKAGLVYGQMTVHFEQLPGLIASVDEVSYDPTRPAPPDRPHPFVYHVSIHN